MGIYLNYYIFLLETKTKFLIIGMVRIRYDVN